MKSIIFYCRGEELERVNDLPVYDAFPRPSGTAHNAAQKWANRNNNMLTFEHKNEFSEVLLNYDTLTYGDSITALIPLSGEAYAKIDLQSDSVGDILQNSACIEHGVIKNPTTLTFKSNVYYLRPIQSPIVTINRAHSWALENGYYSTSHVPFQDILQNSTGRRLIYMGMSSAKKKPTHAYVLYDLLSSSINGRQYSPVVWYDKPLELFSARPTTDDEILAAQAFLGII